MLTEYEKDRILLEVRNISFEFNDKETRDHIVGLAKGIFNQTRIQTPNPQFMPLIVCDETNNTPEVIDRNGFILDVYTKNTYDDNFTLTKFSISGFEVGTSEFHSYWRV